MKSLNLLVLRCADMERSRAFYELLGMSFAKHRHGSGPEHYACEDERGVFELYPPTSEGVRDQTGLGFVVMDLEEQLNMFERGGWTPQAIKRTEWGRSFVVRDPDGRRIEISEGKRPSAPVNPA